MGRRVKFLFVQFYCLYLHLFIICVFMGFIVGFCKSSICKSMFVPVCLQPKQPSTAHCRDSWVVQEQATEVRVPSTCNTFPYIQRWGHFECIQTVLVLRSQAGLEDARANTAGGGSRDPEWPQETMVLLHDLECTFYMPTTPIRTCIKMFFTYLLDISIFYTKTHRPRILNCVH